MKTEVTDCFKWVGCESVKENTFVLQNKSNIYGSKREQKRVILKQAIIECKRNLLNSQDKI